MNTHQTLTTLGEGGLGLLTWASFTRRGELVNLGWSLAVVPRLMDPPKGPVSKQKPRREQMPLYTHTHTHTHTKARGMGVRQMDTWNTLKGL